MSATPIVYDYSRLVVPDAAPAFVRQTALVDADLKYIAPRLAACRQEVFDNARLWATGGPIPPEKQPLDAAFFDLPNQLLDEEREQLDRIVASGNRLADVCDRVVVLGIGGSYMGARAVFEACCHPFHNELARNARSGRPRIYFEGNNLDNDAVAGLLDLLGESDDWGIIVISKSGGTLETAVAFRVFLEALEKGCRGDMAKVRERVVPVTGETGRLRDLADAMELPEVFPIPDGVGGRFSIFSAVGLLPAAVMGVDVERLLKGATAMNEVFRMSAPLENPALDYAGISWLMQVRRGANIRVLSTWGKRLEAVGLWYDQLLAESLGKHGQGPTPLTVVNTRDLHSRGQQHQEGSRDKLITNLFVESGQREPVAVERSDFDQDRLNAMAGRTLPEFLDAARAGTDQAYADDHRPTADIRLPRLDEASLGQLFQMLMIATVAEGRLIGINPYGQPGVEAYKHNMNALLRK
ncbi:MAG: glucose-6-phosphate isomerase [Thermoguttaceae bacterium]|jgi:glucose-6-phosphate isomerase|nr:glucose-6-phosphate isomerase [Thermoguttaceae bacterium]